MKRARFVCGFGGLSAAVVFAALAAAQPPVPSQPIPAEPIEAPPVVRERPPPQSGKEAWTTPSVVQADSVESIMDRLAAIKAEKTRLEKLEQEAVALLKEKLKQQKLRLQKLGVEVQEAPPPPPAVVPST